MTRKNFESSIGEYISQFMEHSRPHMAPVSYERRYSQLLSFDTFLTSVGFTGTDVDEKTVNSWIRSLAPLSDSTIMTYAVSLRKLGEYISGMRLGSVYMPPVKRVNSSYVAHYFSEDELASIFTAADDYPCGGRNPLPYIKAELPMILRILESCGTRLTETLSLQVRHIDLERGVLTMVHSKKEKERIVPMSGSLSLMLEKYCLAMGIVGRPDAYVFPKKDFGAHLEKYDIDNRFSNILKWKGLCVQNRKKYARGICPHCFRHNFALKSFRRLEAQGIHLNDAIPYLSIYLGHDSLLETEKYLRFSAEMFSEELSAFDDAADPIFPNDDIWDNLYEEVVL